MADRERIRMPEDAEWILRTLNAEGYEAFAVGGCIRDSLMGREPKDWDICTSAVPEEVERVFRGQHLIETGLAHGTVTLMLRHVPYEITTYRTDGLYSDHRHPDRVEYVGSLALDLARRDFTVNAMAYHPDLGLQDLWGGREDLREGLIRCVGEPEKRFDEDALRILRALRFSSVYDLKIEQATDAAARKLKDTLARVAPERIWQEMKKLLCGPAVFRVLMDYPDIIVTLFPELSPCVGFEQRNPYHNYTVYEHLCRTVRGTPPDPAMRLAALLHDSGKPECFTLDEKGIGHARGHQAVSAEKTTRAAQRLRLDARTRDEAVFLVEKHDSFLPLSREGMLRALNRYGEDRLRRLLLIQRADALGKGPVAAEVIEKEYAARVAVVDGLVKENACFSLAQLETDGSELKALGLPPGKGMGDILHRLLDLVMAGEIPNRKEALQRKALELDRAARNDGNTEKEMQI